MKSLSCLGLPHICAIDGYSGKIVQFVSMPVKNPVQIYQHLFRPILVEYGLFDQIRVDHHKEWTLSLCVQESLAYLRHSVQKPPHRQGSSTMSSYPLLVGQLLQLAVLRLWSKMVQKYLGTWHPTQEVGRISMEPLYKVGVRLFTSVWKCHNIPGKGIPNERMANARTRRLPSEIIPDAHFATSQFVDMGGHLTLESHFGNDPLAGRNGLIAERNRQFHQ
eukprot:Em0009g243a